MSPPECPRPGQSALLTKVVSPANTTSIHPSSIIPQDAPLSNQITASGVQQLASRELSQTQDDLDDNATHHAEMSTSLQPTMAAETSTVRETPISLEYPSSFSQELSQHVIRSVTIKPTTTIISTGVLSESVDVEFPDPPNEYSEDVSSSERMASSSGGSSYFISSLDLSHVSHPSHPSFPSSNNDVSFVADIDKQSFVPFRSSFDVLQSDVASEPIPTPSFWPSSSETLEMTRLPFSSVRTNAEVSYPYESSLPPDNLVSSMSSFLSGFHSINPSIEEPVDISSQDSSSGADVMSEALVTSLSLETTTTIGSIILSTPNFSPLSHSTILSSNELEIDDTVLNEVKTVTLEFASTQYDSALSLSQSIMPSNSLENNEYISSDMRDQSKNISSTMSSFSENSRYFSERSFWIMNVTSTPWNVFTRTTERDEYTFFPSMKSLDLFETSYLLFPSYSSPIFPMTSSLVSTTEIAPTLSDTASLFSQDSVSSEEGHDFSTSSMDFMAPQTEAFSSLPQPSPLESYTESNTSTDTAPSTFSNPTTVVIDASDSSMNTALTAVEGSSQNQILSTPVDFQSSPLMTTHVSRTVGSDTPLNPSSSDVVTSMNEFSTQNMFPLSSSMAALKTTQVSRTDGFDTPLNPSYSDIVTSMNEFSTQNMFPLPSSLANTSEVSPITTEPSPSPNEYVTITIFLEGDCALVMNNNRSTQEMYTALRQTLVTMVNRTAEPKDMLLTGLKCNPFSLEAQVETILLKIIQDRTAFKDVQEKPIIFSFRIHDSDKKTITIKIIRFYWKGMGAVSTSTSHSPTDITIITLAAIISGVLLVLGVIVFIREKCCKTRFKALNFRLTRKAGNGAGSVALTGLPRSSSIHSEMKDNGSLSGNTNPVGANSSIHVESEKTTSFMKSSDLRRSSGRSSKSRSSLTKKFKSNNAGTKYKKKKAPSPPTWTDPGEANRTRQGQTPYGLVIGLMGYQPTTTTEIDQYAVPYKRPKKGRVYGLAIRNTSALRNNNIDSNNKTTASSNQPSEVLSAPARRFVSLLAKNGATTDSSENLVPPPTETNMDEVEGVDNPTFQPDNPRGVYDSKSSLHI